MYCFHLLLRNPYIHTFTGVFRVNMTFKLLFMLGSDFLCFKEFNIIFKRTKHVYVS
jgi:hypothetical protein